MGDVIEVRLRDVHPTQPCVGFDKIYYKLGRYAKDRRKFSGIIAGTTGN